MAHRPQSTGRCGWLRGLLLVFCLAQAAKAACAGPEGGAEFVVKLGGIAINDCQTHDWQLAHSSHRVIICHVPPDGHTAQLAVPQLISDLVQRLVTWREAIVENEPAQAVYAMHTNLDGKPHRSMDAQWRVFIAHGVWGCALTHHHVDGSLVFADPCNDQKYDSQGLPLSGAVASLLIPPYAMVGDDLIVGRLPVSLSVASASLPPLNLDAAQGSMAEQMVRAARWGHRAGVERLLAAGVDVNARSAEGETALLVAVQRRQTAMVAWLLQHGADRCARYRDGTGPLELAALVSATEIQNLLSRSAPDAGGGVAECPK